MRHGRSCWSPIRPSRFGTGPPSAIGIRGDGAVAADVVFHARFEAVVDDVSVDGVEDDNRVVFHTQGRDGVNPVAVPAAVAGGLEYGFGVIAALTGYDDVRISPVRQRRSASNNLLAA